MTCMKDFSCIGGLEKHIRVVKEMVLFPLMYGDLYAKFNLKPPRGLLFYGPPGTGKTLIASALAVECSNSERKVSFISRKGSDCLSKWVGESEKKLQKIFSLAKQAKPCIIFFDEVDGLVPTRSSRQDFVHASVVTTLLALMDGLDNNSEIIVIGATNRIDAIDPALRRPGRFDRELYFPLPCYAARKEILSVYIKNWKQKPSQKFLAKIAADTVGFCGSDLQALCAEAVMCCVRRIYPQIYNSKSRHNINERLLKVENQDFVHAQRNIVPASHRITIVPVKTLSTRIQPLLQNNLSEIITKLQTLCPMGMLNSDNIIGKALSGSSKCPRILLCGKDDSHTRHLGPALLHNLEHLPCHVLDVMTLFEETGVAVEEKIIQKIKAARRTLPSLLYVPNILAWWNLVDEAARVVFTSLLRDLDQSVHMLILTTANRLYNDLPSDIAILYDNHQEIYEVKLPTSNERQTFFMQLFSGETSGTISNQSSQVNFHQTLNARREKIDNGLRRQKTNTQLIDNNNGNNLQDIVTVTPKRRRMRTRLSTLNCSSSSSLIRSRTSMKRDCGDFGNGNLQKRQKLAYNASIEKLSDSEKQEIIQKIVQLTDKWLYDQLENLFISLELVIEKCEDDVYEAINDCLHNFEETERIKLNIKIEEKNKYENSLWDV